MYTKRICNNAQFSAKRQCAANNIFLFFKKTYAVATAAKVPMEISCEGFFKSPLIFMTAITPVIAGKNTPNTLNQLCPSV